jgi:hypothetical protein
MAAAGAAVAFLLAAGCRSHPPSPAHTKNGPMSNFGPPMQDVRTEIAVQDAEMDYNAAKNSRPTHQYEAEREAARKAEEKKKLEAAKKAYAPRQ